MNCLTLSVCLIVRQSICLSVCRSIYLSIISNWPRLSLRLIAGLVVSLSFFSAALPPLSSFFPTSEHDLDCGNHSSSSPSPTEKETASGNHDRVRGINCGRVADGCGLEGEVGGQEGYRTHYRLGQ